MEIVYFFINFYEDTVIFIDNKLVSYIKRLKFLILFSQYFNNSKCNMTPIVLKLRSRWVHCVLAALLYTFAVTADVVVKAVVDDAGHDANHPIIWIEHKCAGHFGKATQTPVQPHVTIAAALTLTVHFFMPSEPALAGSDLPAREALAPIDPLSSLRC